MFGIIYYINYGATNIIVETFYRKSCCIISGFFALTLLGIRKSIQPVKI